MQQLNGVIYDSRPSDTVVYKHCGRANWKINSEVQVQYRKVYYRRIYQQNQ